jgi:hypothetical protein
MTEERLAEIRARVEAATPGPWTVQEPAWHRGNGPYKTAITAGKNRTVANALTNGKPTFQCDPNGIAHTTRMPEPCADGIFIAAARTDIPELLDEITRLRTENGELRRTCDWCGLPFVPGEKPVPGYEEKLTHKACQREARRAYRQDQLREHGEPERYEREPFTDWPNGQGTYD